MKRTVTIIGLIILNIAFTWAISWGSVLRFGLIVLPMGIGAGQAMADVITSGTVKNIAAFTVIVGAINYFSLKKLVKAQRPLLISCLTALLSIVVCIPFFLSARQSFLDFEMANADITHYIDTPISQVIICNSQDTIAIDDIDNFLFDLKKAKLKRGFWKYRRTEKIIFKNSSGINDTIFTNGQMFGGYKHHWFSADTNILDKYFNKQSE